MSQIMTQMVVRLFAGGLICSAAMILAGGGAKKEIVRLCCACLMLILVLSPLRGADLDLSRLLEAQSDLEAQIEQGILEAGQAERDQMAQKLEEHVAAIARGLGAECQARVDCRLAGQELHIVSVTLTHRGESEALLDRLRRAVAADLGLGHSQIIFRKADDHEG